MANPKTLQKLYPKQSVPKIDTLNTTFNKKIQVLYDGFRAWDSLRNFRKMAQRHEMYTFGNQLGDLINVDGQTMTEEEYLRKQGQVPLKNNLIRGTIRTITGSFSSVQTEPICISRDRDKQGKGETMSNTLQYNYQTNRLWGVDRLQLQYMLLTGLSVYKSSFGYRRGLWEVWTDTPNYNDFFFDNHMKDPRHWDCHLVGEIHDLGLYDVIAKFSDGSKENAERIKNLYRYSSEQTVSYLESLTRDYSYKNDFFIPQDPTRCRVIEIWTLESKERLLVKDRLKGEVYKCETEEEKILIAENKKRRAEQSAMGVTPENMRLLEYEWFVDNYWYFHFLTPTGDVLKEDETPYWHMSHPYSFKIYPFYNGRVYPFVGDYIDQQRYINRIIMMQDMISRHSAKGVLMFPESAKPDGMSMDEITDTWAQYDGVIYYKPTPGRDVPQQIIANSSDPGLDRMLQVQMKMFQDVSGIVGALQGQAPTAGTPAALYAQQTNNAQISLIDTLEHFKECREERDWKNMKLIQQFYDQEKYININGVQNKEIVYKPQDIRDAEFDLQITESTSAPVYRMITNQFLENLMNQQMITVEEYLKMSSIPGADKLLQMIETRKNEAKQNAQQQGMYTPMNAEQQQMINQQ